MKNQGNAELSGISNILRYSELTVWEIFFDEDKCIVLSIPGRGAEKKYRKYNYERFIEKCTAKFIPEQYREETRRELNLEKLRTELEKGTKEINVRIKRENGNAVYNRFQVRVLPKDFENGNIKTAVFILKEYMPEPAVTTGISAENRFNLAIKNTYATIFDVNFTANTYKMNVYSDRIAYNMPAQGRYSDGIRFVAKNLISSEQRGDFIKNMSKNNILKEFEQGYEALGYEYKMLHSESGKYKWVSLRVTRVSGGSDGEMALVFVRDIDSKKRDELKNKEMKEKYRLLKKQIDYHHRLRMSDSRYKIIVQQTGASVFEWIRENNSLYVSESMPEVFGAELLRHGSLEKVFRSGCVHKDDLKKCEEFLENIRNKCSGARVVCRMSDGKDDYIWYRISVSNIFDRDGTLERIVGTVLNIDSETKAMEALRYSAEYDTVTGAPNMNRFTKDVTEIFERDGSGKYAVIRMDINKFKVINDLYRRTEGDKVLRFIAGIIGTLGERRGEIKSYAYLGSDIFVMFTEYTDSRTLIGIVREIDNEILKYPVQNQLKLSYGICIAEDASTPVNALCDRAALAIKTVKGSLICNYAFYDDRLREKMLEEKAIEDDMNKALAGGEFKLYLQPKYNIETSEVIGAESLVRWVHPEKGVISPIKFISLFEKNGFIIKLDEYMWEQTCMTLRRWLDEGRTVVPVSVNISRVHANNPKLYETLVGLVRKYNLPPRYIELELTESAFMEDTGGLTDMLEKLRDAGFMLAMDDFGSGYSSLNMLKNVPIDIVKIDREFLNETVDTDKGKTVIKYTIAMAKQLKMEVIAEGVETIEQAAFLLEAGCYIAQGFYYSRPVDVEQFEKIAFSAEDKEVAPEINNVIEHNYDISYVMMEIDDSLAYKGFVDDIGISPDKVMEFKRIFVKLLDKYRNVVKNLDSSLFEVNFNNNTVYSSYSSKSHFRNKNIFTFEGVREYTLAACKPEDRERVEQYFDINKLREMARNEKSESFVIMMSEGKDDVWVKIGVIPISDKGMLERVIYVFTDINKEKTYEIRLEESLSECESILQLTGEKFFVWDLNNDEIMLSNGAKNIFEPTGDGYSIKLSDILSGNAKPEIGDAARKEIFAQIGKILNGEKNAENFKAVGDNGTEYSVNSKTIYNKSGKPHKVIGVINVNRI